MSIVFFILSFFIHGSALYSSQDKPEKSILDKTMWLIVKILAPNDPSHKLTKKEFSDSVDHRLKISIAISTATILVILIKLIRKIFSNKKIPKKSNLTEPNKQEGLSKQELFEYLILDTIKKPKVEKITINQQQKNKTYLINLCKKLEPQFKKMPPPSKIINNYSKSNSIIEKFDNLSESTASTMPSDELEEDYLEKSLTSDESHLPLKIPTKYTDKQIESSPTKSIFQNQKAIQAKSEEPYKPITRPISESSLKSTTTTTKSNTKSSSREYSNSKAPAPKINPPESKNQIKNILNDYDLPEIPPQLKYKNLCRDPQCPHKIKLHEHHFYNQKPTTFTKRIPLVFTPHTFCPVKSLHKNLFYKQIPIQFIKKASIVVLPTQTLHQVKSIVYNEIPYINKIAPFNNIINLWEKIRI